MTIWTLYLSNDLSENILLYIHEIVQRCHSHDEKGTKGNKEFLFGPDDIFTPVRESATISVNNALIPNRHEAEK